MNESINDEAVFRTAPATPGLLQTKVILIIISDTNKLIKAQQTGQNA